MSSDFITPERQIKVAIENSLTLPGIVKIPALKMEEQVNEVYDWIFDKRNERALLLLLVDLQRKEEDK